VWLLRVAAVSRSVVWLWNIMGLLLLVNIIAIAVLSTPVPFRRFSEGPPNLLPACSRGFGCRASWCRWRWEVTCSFSASLRRKQSI
jgi:hypothetical protein